MHIESESSPLSEDPQVTLAPARLRNMGLFGALPEPALVHLAQHLEVVEVEPGTHLFREGDPANCMYLVLMGDMEVLKKSRTDTDTRVAVLGPGDWFGEMGVIDVQSRSATVMAASPGQLIKLTSKDLDRLYRFDVKAYALIILNIAREMSRRLRVADGIMADLITNVAEGYAQSHRSTI